jgi:hypothetical protein
MTYLTGHVVWYRGLSTREAEVQAAQPRVRLRLLPRSLGQPRCRPETGRDYLHFGLVDLRHADSEDNKWKEDCIVVTAAVSSVISDSHLASYWNNARIRLADHGEKLPLAGRDLSVD